MKTTTIYLFVLFLVNTAVAEEVRNVYSQTDYASDLKKSNVYPVIMLLPEKYTYYETDIYGNRVRSESLNDLLPVDTTNANYRIRKRNERIEKYYGVPAMNQDPKNQLPERSSRFRK